jgi:hypothetical protein
MRLALVALLLAGWKVGKDDKFLSVQIAPSVEVAWIDGCGRCWVPGDGGAIEDRGPFCRATAPVYRTMVNGPDAGQPAGCDGEWEEQHLVTCMPTVVNRNYTRRLADGGTEFKSVNESRGCR